MLPPAGPALLRIPLESTVPHNDTVITAGSTVKSAFQGTRRAIPAFAVIPVAVR
jgi:hypothetical protein